MPKNETKTQAKKNKKEIAVKKARKKKVIIAVITLLITAGAIGFFVYLSNQPKPENEGINSQQSPQNEEISRRQIQENEEIYRYGGQTIRLLSDGSFIASMAHGIRKEGTYSKTTEGDITTVIFNSNGRDEIGRIINNTLHIPQEWDDGHGHGNRFPKIN